MHPNKSKFNYLFSVFLLSLIFGVATHGNCQTAYYIDGFHGGIWGHYPDWNTRFMGDQLKKHPDWKINLEIEPETWDQAAVKDSAAYADFQALFTDQSMATARIEYVNPDYAQSYLFDIEGESMISQFYYGIKMVKQHFPTAIFPAYSSEEPCFTSALPQILTSFGFKYASLKNPNTCWGGYTSAYGGEIVNWIGPDGTKIITSPRYAVEALQPGSTWQTIASGNYPEYIKACFAAGIKHPIGMTLQDAGWKNGPMLGDGTRAYQPTVYTTWANYFENVAIKSTTDNWKFTQEDVLVSLVWGSQILQRIAQEVRHSENTIVSTQKLAVMAKINAGVNYPQADFDKAWRPLLLSQHHDCWIVPYNGKPGDTWADKVVKWTGTTDRITDSLDEILLNRLSLKSTQHKEFITIYNTLAVSRNESVAVNIPETFKGKDLEVVDNLGKVVSSQIIQDSTSASPKIVFKAMVPSMGYNTYQLKAVKNTQSKNMTVAILKNGLYKVKSDLYTITLDPKKGGAITSLIANAMNNKEFVDQANPTYFNALRGNFHYNGGLRSSAESPAAVTILEKGSEQIKLQIKGTIADNPFTQIITVIRGEPRIDMQVKIDWKANQQVGDYTEPGTFKATNYHKAFYNDKQKLLLAFPLNLRDQKVYKDAPFDVLESRLKNTFFTSWDSIKNNIILNWVDVTNSDNSYGMALLTDHTTNYEHGEDFPLGLTLAYSGVGLWGRDYKIIQPTNVHYAIIPHAGKWDKSHIWTAAAKWNEPLITTVSATKPSKKQWSMLNIKGDGLNVTDMSATGNDIIIRLFNSEGDDNRKEISFNGIADRAELIALNGEKIEDIQLKKDAEGKESMMIGMPRFGIRTIKLYNAKATITTHN
jgi:alpha-mannosidase